MKKILVIHYSQSGQLTEVTRSILAPLRASGEVEIHEEAIRPLTPYPFPWGFFTFLDAFPETVQLIAPAVEPLTIAEDAPFDLIILAYQVWYLSPSPPITAFLTSEAGRKLLAGKPVITVIACRNMWLMAQETVKRLLREAGATLVDNLTFVDRAPVLATLITTPRWLLTGKREGFLGLPRAGVSAEDIAGAARFGHALVDALGENREKTGQAMLTGLAATSVDPAIIMSEKAGYRAFRIWSKLLCRIGRPGQWRRRPALLIFVAYLLTMIVTVVPFTLLLRQLLTPFFRKRLAALKTAYEEPSGSASHNLSKYPP
ncbi:MAG: dialkylresorcinol condensing enzyme [Betaproteobacteria bacterium]|nr:dialkylresorcinol condensing enzyme [Betaproteobacteria bacterium]